MKNYRAFLNILYILTGNIHVSFSDCITWQIADPRMILTCRIDRLEFDVYIVDPNENELAVCKDHVCALKDGIGSVQQNQDTNETVYTTIIHSNINGPWICRHGNTEIRTIVSTSDGILPAIYVHINGELAMANMKTFVKLLCWSCWQPVDYNAEFFINSVSKDNVRLFNDTCYHSKGKCTLEKCMCVSMSSAMYRWTYEATNLFPPVLFSCEMRFKDNFTTAVFKKRATVEFNGKEFVKGKTITNLVVAPRRTVNVTQPTIIIPENVEDNETVIIWILGSVTFVIFAACAAPVILCVRKKKISQNKGSEYMPLSGRKPTIKNAFHDFACSTCRNITSYAYCLTCSAVKCETCTKEHTKKMEKHTVIQIADINLQRKGLYCATCKGENPEKICIKCKTLLCKTVNCRCAHYESRFSMPLVVIKTEYTDLQRSAYASPDTTIKLSYTVKITQEKKATRIRGVELLSLYNIAVLDYGNWKITIYKYIKANVTTKSINLKNEPRAMTRISTEKLAVTYAYQREIVIVDVNTKRFKYISLKKIGKPYSIAYMDNHFAVEIGEGEDGMIVVVNMEGQEISRIENIESICFFTGNTIRLALDMTKHVIYASTMGRDEVVCFNFESNEIVWNEKVPSPRGVIVVFETFKENNFTYSNTSVLLCSKESNTIYKLDTKTGKKDVIMDETTEIKSPRYISCFQTNRQCFLAIETGSDCIKVFKADISVGAV